MHYPHAGTVVSIEEVLNVIDVAQTVVVVALECHWQV